MFLQRKWISRVREEKGQGTVEYFLVILAATALAFVGLNWLQGDDGGGLIEGLFGNVIDWVMNMF